MQYCYRLRGVNKATDYWYEIKDKNERERRGIDILESTVPFRGKSWYLFVFYNDPLALFHTTNIIGCFSVLKANSINLTRSEYAILK
jgi:hypothetical protein